MKKGENKKQSKPQRNTWIDVVGFVLKGGALAGATAILVLVLCAAAISGGVMKERWMRGCVLTACMLGGLIGGRYTVVRSRGQSLLKGVSVGGILFLIQMTAGLLVYGRASLEQGAGLLLMGVLGGGLSALPGKGGGRKRKP